MRRFVPAMAATASLLIVLGACGGGGGGSAANNDASSGGSKCVPKHAGLKTVTPGQLTVAAYQYPPFSDVKDGTLGGAEGKIITRVAKMECLKPVLKAGAAASMIPSVTSGRADTTIGDWYRTKERAKVVILGAPVLRDQLTFISKSGVATVPELKGKKVGSILGFLWNDDLKNMLGSNLKLYDTAQAEYADLAAGRIDVIVDTYPSAVSTLKTTRVAGAKLVVPPADSEVAATENPGQSMFPVNKDNPKLAKALDADVAELRGSGELAKIIKPFGFKASAAQPGKPNEL
jgi:polar amino acid transport system substrate-binding protein